MNAVSKTDRNGLSAIHVIGILFGLGLGALVTIGVIDNRQKDRLQKETQQARLEKITTLAKDYYGKGDVQAGTFGLWKVVNVASRSDNPMSDKINNVDVQVAVDDRTFRDIQGRSPEGRFRAAANGCPPIGHEIYRILTNNDNLTLRVEVGGNVFIDVDCSRWAAHIGPRS